MRVKGQYCSPVRNKKEHHGYHAGKLITWVKLTHLYKDANYKSQPEKRSLHRPGTSNTSHKGKPGATWLP